MILILSPDAQPHSAEYRQLLDHLGQLPRIKTRIHQEKGVQQTLTEIYLIGDTASLSLENMESLPGVERVVRIS